jgi:hypothetical protein
LELILPQEIFNIKLIEHNYIVVLSDVINEYLKNNNDNELIQSSIIKSIIILMYNLTLVINCNKNIFVDLMKDIDIIAWNDYENIDTNLLLAIENAVQLIMINKKHILNQDIINRILILCFLPIQDISKDKYAGLRMNLPPMPIYCLNLFYIKIPSIEDLKLLKFLKNDGIVLNLLEYFDLRKSEIFHHYYGFFLKVVQNVKAFATFYLNNNINKKIFINFFYTIFYYQYYYYNFLIFDLDCSCNRSENLKKILKKNNIISFKNNDNYPYFSDDFIINGHNLLEMPINKENQDLYETITTIVDDYLIRKKMNKNENY